MNRSGRLALGVMTGTSTAFLLNLHLTFGSSNQKDAYSLLSHITSIFPTSHAYAPQCEENMIFPSSFTMLNPPRPPLPTLSSSLSVAEQARQLDETLAYGLPSIENLVVRKPYIASINFERRTPRWVAEYYRPGEFMDKAKRAKAIAAVYLDETENANSNGSKLDRKNFRFASDPTVPSLFRSNPADYMNSGYARGHLAPAAAHSMDEVDLLETFILSANIVPQNGVMNAADWAKLEAFARGLSEHFRHVRVISGPAYLPKYGADGKRSISYEVVGKNDVAVPTHLFKVIYAEEPISTAVQGSMKHAFPGMSSRLERVSLPETSRGFSVSSIQDSSPQNVAVNTDVTALNKAIVKSKANAPMIINGIRTVYIAAFLMPNNETASGTPLKHYLVPLQKIEKHTGLCLTPRSSPLSITMTTSSSQ